MTLNGYDSTIVNYRPDHDSLKSMCKKISTQQAHRLVGISNIDYQVKLIIEKLKREGLYDETAIIFMADHGIEPGKATCLDRGMKVPLIVKIPGAYKKGIKTDVLVQNIDWFPTILKYAGISPPGNHKLDGVELNDFFECPVLYFFWYEAISGKISDSGWFTLSF